MTTILPPALALVAHQDDAELVMGVMLRNHLEHDREVHVACIGTGTGSGVQPQLAMSDTEFTWHRDDEQRRAARTLGVLHEHIHLPAQRAPGGTITTPEQARTWIQAVLDDLGMWNAHIKTYTDKDCPGAHIEHRAVGKAVRQLAAEGMIVAPRFYIEPWLLDDWRTANPATNYGPESCQRVDRVHAALREYTLQDPQASKEGIGGRSVPDIFAAELNDPNLRNWVHL